jgi:hypothetical protein
LQRAGHAIAGPISAEARVFKAEQGDHLVSNGLSGESTNGAGDRSTQAIRQAAGATAVAVGAAMLLWESKENGDVPGQVPVDEGGGTGGTSDLSAMVLAAWRWRWGMAGLGNGGRWRDFIAPSYLEDHGLWTNDGEW